MEGLNAEDVAGEMSDRGPIPVVVYLDHDVEPVEHVVTDIKFEDDRMVLTVSVP